MNKARRFVIETPLGKLEVYAKHDKSDCAEDYPGVFIDLYARMAPRSCWLVWSMIRTRFAPDSRLWRLRIGRANSDC